MDALPSLGVESPFSEHLVLSVASRWPTKLAAETVSAVLQAPLDRMVRPLAATRSASPRLSVVVVTLDALVFTRLCLESLLAASSSPDLEVIVVDNGSADGTVEYLGALSGLDGRVRVELNGRNIGFAAATNRGATLARGDVLVLLNNDTIVPPGALEELAGCVGADSTVGLLGVVTNRAGNEAEIEVPYRTYGDFGRFARERMRRHTGKLFDIRTVTMFCAALRRDVWNEVGPLDERFGIGLFEDDDYAMRVREAGYRVACAEDVFVHHFGQASIGRLGPTGEYGPLYHGNRERLEEKWGIAWAPYEHREKPEYLALVDRIRRFVSEVVPHHSTVLVISKGDAELLKLENHRAWHFPQVDDGTYAGHNPADSAACIAELGRMRAKGAQFLVIPSTSTWWLTHYEEFARHLADEHSVRAGRDSCVVYSIQGDQP